MGWIQIDARAGEPAGRILEKMAQGRGPSRGRAATDAAERAELVEDQLDRHLLALEPLGDSVPDHGVLEGRLVDAVALGHLKVVHQREDALALGGVGRDEQRDDDELEHA